MLQCLPIPLSQTVGIFCWKLKDKRIKSSFPRGKGVWCSPSKGNHFDYHFRSPFGLGVRVVIIVGHWYYDYDRYGLDRNPWPPATIETCPVVWWQIIQNIDSVGGLCISPCPSCLIVNGVNRGDLRGDLHPGHVSVQGNANRSTDFDCSPQVQSYSDHRKRKIRKKNNWQHGLMCSWGPNWIDGAWYAYNL